jgi:hypothetical protein
MPARYIILLVLGWLIFDTMIVCAIVSSAMAPIKNLAFAYPIMPMHEPNTRRKFQTVRVGMAGFGKCVHFTIDQEYVHVDPAMIARWFGFRAMSLPRKLIVPTGKEPGFQTRGLVEVQVGKAKMWIPGWVVGEIQRDSELPDKAS